MKKRFDNKTTCTPPEVVQPKQGDDLPIKRQQVGKHLLFTIPEHDFVTFSSGISIGDPRNKGEDPDHATASVGIETPYGVITPKHRVIGYHEVVQCKAVSWYDIWMPTDESYRPRHFFSVRLAIKRIQSQQWAIDTRIREDDLQILQGDLMIQTTLGPCPFLFDWREVKYWHNDGLLYSI